MKPHRLDTILLLVVAILVLLGIMTLASASAVFAQAHFGKSTYYLLHQLYYGILPGIALGVIGFKIKTSTLKRLAVPFLLASLVLMALVFVPRLGIFAGGASRWLNLGIASLQPSELLKLSFILYSAAWLANRTEKEKLSKTKTSHRNWKDTLAPFLVVLGVVAALLVFQSDASTLGIIIVVAIAMYFTARTPLWHTVLIVAAALASVFGTILLEPYRMRRVWILLDPSSDPMGKGYQITQALIAVGSGGLKGLGLGVSNRRLSFLPQATSDSIFSIFAQELGFIGSLILLVLFLLLLWRSFRIAKYNTDRFSQLLAVGLSVWICTQAFMNIGAMIGVAPVAGIPLPFLSYGGSHILVELAAIGLLLNISRFAET